MDRTDKDTQIVKPWRVWKEMPFYKHGGRYFETAKDYKADMIRRAECRNIRSAHINRKLSKYEEISIVPFVEQCLCFRKDNYSESTALYWYYEEFCKENKMTPLRPTVFGTCIKSYVFLQEKIPGVLFARKDVYLNENVVGYYNLGLKNPESLNG